MVVRLLSQWNPGLCSCLHACPCFLSFLVHSFTCFIHRFIYSHTSGCPHSFAPTLSCFQHLLTPVPGWAHRMQGQGAVRQGLALSRAFAFSGRCPSGRGQRAWFVPHLPREAAPPPLHPGSQTAEEGEGWGKRRVSLAVPPIWESLCI